MFIKADFPDPRDVQSIRIARSRRNNCCLKKHSEELDDVVVMFAYDQASSHLRLLGKLLAVLEGFDSTEGSRLGQWVFR